MIGRTFYTYDEILNQPALWREVIDLIFAQSEDIKDFMEDISSHSTVIFTGSGSSFFIGEMVAPFFGRDLGMTCKAVEATELVTHPELYVSSQSPAIVISFARSGNSPESVAAINNVNKINPDSKHLIITCNQSGALAQLDHINLYTIVLPEKANDKSLAMTSSVTSMALTALMVGRLQDMDTTKNKIIKAANLVESSMSSFIDIALSLAKIDFKRCVFLGSGPIKGVAREAHLKLQELTDGEIICKFDSFLGFRHGPKAIVNESTLVVYIFSNSSYVRQYELDLIKGNNGNRKPKLTIGIANNQIENLDLDMMIILGGETLDDAIWTICSLVPLQLIALFKSLEMGYNPDSPSKSGAIHRVVQGVNIYEYSNGIKNKK